MHIYNETKNGNISIEKIEEDQKQFKSKLNEINTGNPKYKPKDQETKLSNYIMIMQKLCLRLCKKQNGEQDLKYYFLSKCFKDYQ